MSRNMNNFTPLPRLRRTDSRAYDAPPHTSNNPHEFNEVPVFFRSITLLEPMMRGRSTPLVGSQKNSYRTSQDTIVSTTPQTYNHNEDMRRRGFNPTRQREDRSSDINSFLGPFQSVWEGRVILIVRRERTVKLTRSHPLLQWDSHYGSSFYLTNLFGFPLPSPY
ncbi:hypothetical protein MTR_4g080600 [Medicago truncatula]|uniref:Uncharacterized protein n=1 Tax=Medicago truncatula TaxID=3880 RepID=G7JDU2_MEDTR|nr:hypothetical protein MTR_4g080600 [Medicago truncatula]